MYVDRYLLPVPNYPLCQYQALSLLANTMEWSGLTDIHGFSHVWAQWRAKSPNVRIPMKTLESRKKKHLELMEMVPRIKVIPHLKPILDSSNASYDSQDPSQYGSMGSRWGLQGVEQGLQGLQGPVTCFLGSRVTEWHHTELPIGPAPRKSERMRMSHIGWCPTWQRWQSWITQFSTSDKVLAA